MAATSTSTATAAAAVDDSVAAASSDSNANPQARRPPPSPYSSEQSDAESDAEGDGDASAAQPPDRAQQPLLPSLSGAALMQLRGGGNNGSSNQAATVGDSNDDDGDDGDDDDDGDDQRRYHRRSRSRSFERLPTTTTPATRVPESDVVGRGDDRSSFSDDGREVRIVFHGREVFADDLVGLRVAKSFAGIGRFLGQVVRFDEPTARFTVVYADGDAEELSVDHTIQIIIQDEIERADPALPPVAVATPAAHGESPEKSDAQPPPPASQQPLMRSHSGGAGGAPSGPRLAVQISEREAQFVVGLFENHALPVLLRDGWKVQASAPGAEHRYYSPPGNFPGAGHMFPSALAVVELIASDERMLAACFPQNVRAGILSLFVDSSRKSDSARKRVPAPSVDDDAYDPKRQRAAGRESSAGGPPPTTHTRSLSMHHGAPPAPPSSRRYSGANDYRSYHSDDVAMERMPLSDQYGDVLPPSSRANDRGGVRAYHQDAGEYRMAGGASMRVSPESASVARWPSNTARASLAPSSLEAEEYRRHYVDSPGWRERELPSRGGGSYALGPQFHRDGYQRADGAYYADPRALRSSARVIPGGGGRGGGGGEAPPGSYRYQDVRNSPSRGSPGAEQFHHQGSGRVPAHPSLDTQALVRLDAEYRVGSEQHSAHGAPGRDASGAGAPGRDAFMLRGANPRSAAPSPADQQQQQQLMRAASDQAKWGSHRSPPERVGYEHGDLSQSLRGGDPGPASGSHHLRYHPQQQQQQLPLQPQHRLPLKADSYADSSGSRGSAAEMAEQRRAGNVGPSSLPSSSSQPDAMI